MLRVAVHLHSGAVLRWENATFENSAAGFEAWCRANVKGTHILVSSHLVRVDDIEYIVRDPDYTASSPP